MPKEKQAQFRPEQLPPRAFHLIIVAAAVASAVVAGIWKAIG